MSKSVEFSGVTHLVVEILRCQKVDFSKKWFSYWRRDPRAMYQPRAAFKRILDEANVPYNEDTPEEQLKVMATAAIRRKAGKRLVFTEILSDDLEHLLSLPYLYNLKEEVKLGG